MTSRQEILGAVVAGGVAFGRFVAPSPPPLVFGCETFSPNASVESLRHALGTDDVTADSLPLGDTEGQMVPATIFFAGDARRRIAVVWKDRAHRQSPKYVQLGRAVTEWQTRQGITIGTSLKELERLNGRPFRLAGFAFDESGAVVSWSGGRLAAFISKTCELRMNLDSIASPPSLRDKWYNQVTGDRVFSSGHPAMQAIDPRVSELLLIYR